MADEFNRTKPMESREAGQDAVPSEPANEEPVFLVSIADGLEAGMLEALLDQAGIPVLRKYPETGQVLHMIMGTSLYGTELYVPADRLEEAMALLEGVGMAAESDDMSEEMAELNEAAALDAEKALEAEGIEPEGYVPDELTNEQGSDGQERNRDGKPEDRA